MHVPNTRQQQADGWSQGCCSSTCMSFLLHAFAESEGLYKKGDFLNIRSFRLQKCNTASKK